MYKPYNEVELKEKFGKNIRKIMFNDSEFMITRDGNIFRKMKSCNFKEIKNNPNHKKGYNVILINKKQYMRSFLIALAWFPKFKETTEKYIVSIHHINNNKLDCKANNLKMVRQQISSWKILRNFPCCDLLWKYLLFLPFQIQQL